MNWKPELFLLVDSQWQMDVEPSLMSQSAEDWTSFMANVDDILHSVHTGQTM